jgi:hypothetical protein
LTLSSGSPSPAVLDLLEVLRRPPTREDLAAARSYVHRGSIDDHAVLTIYRRFVRIIHLPGGHTAQIVIGTGQESLPKSALYPCQRAITRILERLLPGHPAAVQREALRIKRSYKLGSLTHGIHPWLNYMGAGGSGGPLDLRGFRRRGLMLEGSGQSGGPHGARTENDANGLVPDGVTTVTLKLSGSARRGSPPGLVKDYYLRHPTTLTTAVIQNAFYMSLPAEPMATHQTVIWRNTQGHVIREFGF